MWLNLRHPSPRHARLRREGWLVGWFTAASALGLAGRPGDPAKITTSAPAVLASWTGVTPLLGPWLLVPLFDD